MPRVYSSGQHKKSSVRLLCPLNEEALSPSKHASKATSSSPLSSFFLLCLLRACFSPSHLIFLFLFHYEEKTESISEPGGAAQRQPAPCAKRAHGMKRHTMGSLRNTEPELCLLWSSETILVIYSTGKLKSSSSLMQTVATPSEGWGMLQGRLMVLDWPPRELSLKVPGKDPSQSLFPCFDVPWVISWHPLFFSSIKRRMSFILAHGDTIAHHPALLLSAVGSQPPRAQNTDISTLTNTPNLTNSSPLHPPSLPQRGKPVPHSLRGPTLAVTPRFNLLRWISHRWSAKQSRNSISFQHWEIQRVAW